MSTDPRETLRLRTEDAAAYQRMTRDQRMAYLRWRRELEAQPADPLNPGAGPKHDVRPSSWMAARELEKIEQQWIADGQLLAAADAAVNDVMTWEIGIIDEVEQLEAVIANHPYEMRDELPRLKERLALRQRLLKQLASGDIIERHALFREYRDAKISPEAIQEVGKAFLTGKTDSYQGPAYRQDSAEAQRVSEIAKKVIKESQSEQI